MRLFMTMSVALAVAACSGEAPASDFASTDSAGVAIIWSKGAAPAIDSLAEPILSIGSEADTTQQLFQVRGAVQFDNGNIAVLNAGSHEVRVYSPTGAMVGAVGRRGEGPGEFRFPVMMLEHQDSVHVFDPSGLRFTVVDPEGRLARTYPAGGTLSGLTDFIGDQKVVSAFPSMPRVAGNALLSAPMLVRTLDIATGVGDTIGLFGRKQEYQLVYGEEIFLVSVPFTVNPSVAVWAGSIAVTDGATPDIAVYDRTGRLLKILREDLPLRPVSDADVSRVVQAQLARQEDYRYRAALTEAYRRLPDVEAMPVYDQLLSSPYNQIWARQFAPEGADWATWSVFDEGGRRIAHVAVPARLRARYIGGSGMVGTMTDELGRESVVVYPIAGAVQQSFRSDLPAKSAP